MIATDLSHLRRLAEAYSRMLKNSGPWKATIERDYSDAANPAVVLALLDEIEAARGVVKAARGVSDPGLDRLRGPLADYDRAIGAGGEG